MKVRIPEFGDPALKRWSKLLTGVDVAFDNGYCFVGRFLSSGKQEVLVPGDLVLQFGKFREDPQDQEVVGVKLLRYEGAIWKTMYTKQDICPSSWAREVKDDILVISGPAVQDPKVLEKPRAMPMYPRTPRNPGVQIAELALDSTQASKAHYVDLTNVSIEDLVSELIRRNIPAASVLPFFE